MAWEASVISKEPDPTNGNIKVTVRFSDGKASVQDVVLSAFDLDDAYIKDIVARRLETLEAREVNIERVSVGKVTPEKKPHDVAQQEFAKAYHRAQVAIEAGRIGLLTAEQVAGYVDAAKALYAPEYLGL